MTRARSKFCAYLFATGDALRWPPLAKVEPACATQLC